MRSVREEGPGSSDCPHLTFRCSPVPPVPLVSSWNPDLAVFGQLAQWYPHFLGRGIAGILSVFCCPTWIISSGPSEDPRLGMCGLEGF